MGGILLQGMEGTEEDAKDTNKVTTAGDSH